ncbi:MAG: hypothetical protein ABIA47_00065 [bacterium]
MIKQIDRIKSIESQEVNFDALQLSELAWSKPDEQGYSESRMSITIDGKLFELLATRGKSNAMDVFDFTVSKERRNLINVRIGIGRNKPDPDTKGGFFDMVSTDVARYDIVDPELPRKSGVKIYKKALDFIETQVQDNLMIHRVVAAPSDDDYEAWHKRFDPVLSERGYMSDDDGMFWEKEFEPTAQAAA